jgi:hypothetical protein
LRKLSPGDLADEIGVLEARIDALKGEAIRRELHRAEGQAFKITLTPPGTSQRTDKAVLLKHDRVDEMRRADHDRVDLGAGDIRVRHPPESLRDVWDPIKSPL